MTQAMRRALSSLIPAGTSRSIGLLLLALEAGEPFRVARALADELRASGSVFRSASDSEVAAHAYDAWGTDCFDRFDGNHTYYSLEEPMPPNSILTLTLTPEPGVDVNLYGYQIGQTSFAVPPAVPSVVACEASYPASPFVDANPGELETISFYNPSDTASYNIFYAVAGAHGATSGGYTLEAQLHVGATHCEEALPGQTHSSWPSNVEQLSVGAAGLGSLDVAGDLAAGACMNLAFASNSSVACFPATQDASFQGNQVFYAFVMPPASEATISLTSANATANLYGYMNGDDTYMVPPHVPSTITCEASIPPVTDVASDTIYFQNTADVPRNILLAVSGENGAVTGEFDLNVDVHGL